jgi:leucyl aminopeptidase
MNITFAKPSLTGTATLVVGCAEDGTLTPSAARLDKTSGGALSKAVAHARFKGKAGQTLTLMAPAGVKAGRIVLLGFGVGKALDGLAAAKLGGAIVAALAMSGESRAAVVVEKPKGCRLASNEVAAQIGHGARLRSYRFDKYRTKQKKTEKPSLTRLTVMCLDVASARAAFKLAEALAEGVALTRDLVSEPANVLTPPVYAKKIRQLSRDGINVEVLNEARLKRMGMGAIVGVAQGSQHGAHIVVMRWNGAGARGNKAPVAFVGKGVTFDTGGISIKPSAGMEDMKWDMGGSAVVVGLMRALARRNAKVNAVGVVGLVENMPSGTAQRPGDVVSSYSGQTIEILNTDAEGRLVLADALWYTQSRFKPRFMVDLATLTGAIIVSLGNYQAGLFANDDKLSQRLVAAGKAVAEPVWPMPMDDHYDKLIKSDIADMKNIGGRGGGSVSAAKFLERFVNKVPWAHLDIAGVTWTKEGSELVPKGGTGFGVRLLDRLVADHYEG